MNPPEHQFIFQIERPHPKLMTYYLLTCLCTGPLFPILILPAYFRYHTMRYRFDGEGISMRWGILFRREIILNYARIQDIHLSSNIVERWLGLARVQIQTASGSSSAEMTIEGLLQYDAIRDFLYSKMRGLKEPPNPQHSPAGTTDSVMIDAAAVRQLSEAIQQTAAELRQIRELLTRRLQPPAGNDD